MLVVFQPGTIVFPSLPDKGRKKGHRLSSQNGNKFTKRTGLVSQQTEQQCQVHPQEEEVSRLERTIRESTPGTVSLTINLPNLVPYHILILKQVAHFVPIWYINR